ncbi:glycosyltransferase family 4 protein [Rhodoblastus sp.]|uniref:glycosyltransferase family 4 protein n=1 Tax=Rhodoblastus sp. TaxID=1962975 RepID=UPI0025D6A96D|nr:glycosyltransferase family 4 protein [Rhodoblastus sp.]
MAKAALLPGSPAQVGEAGYCVGGAQNDARLFPPVSPAWTAKFQELYLTDPQVRVTINEMATFYVSGEIHKLCRRAAAFEPNIGIPSGNEAQILPQWHDAEYHQIVAMRRILPPGPFVSVVLMPCCRLGGADFVAGVLANAISKLGRTLILRTEGSEWERPDWFHETVASIDISGVLAAFSNKPRALYTLIQEIAPKRIFNVNSRICFEMFDDFGAQLAVQFRLYAYYFCADRTPEGIEVGYPVMYFASIIQHLSAAILDSADLARSLTARYALPPELQAKLFTIYSPAMTPVAEMPAVRPQVQSRPSRPRPLLLWAGRLDRQKRFDLLLTIAQSMPDVDFACWGKAVLDAPPDLTRLPPNVTMHGSFASFGELPLAASDGWIYTSAWDGLPTILIECAALGVPITASAVGGVPELIDEETGWPVREPEDPSAYVAALRDMLSDAGARIAKVHALQARIRSRHTPACYDQALKGFYGE